jgi:hypothetical protein
MPSTSFEPDAADLIAANRLHFWSSLRWRRTILGYFAGGALFAVIGMMFMWDSSGAAAVAGVIVGFAFWSLVLASILLVNFLLIPMRSRRTFVQQKALQYRVDVEWSDVGVSLTSEQGKSKFQWRDFLRVEQGKDVILLFQSEHLFNFIPKRALSANHAADFIQKATGRQS